MRKLLIAAAFAIATLSCLQEAPGASATWLLNASNGGWNEAGNWTVGGPPNGAGDVATFNASNWTNVRLGDQTVVAGITFNGPSGFVIQAYFGLGLTLQGTGITNNSGITQSFQTAAGNNSNGAIFFYNSATAGTLTSFDNFGSQNGDRYGFLWFANSSTAGSATVLNRGSRTAGVYGGAAYFLDSSTAANATVNNNAGTVPGAFGGFAYFYGGTADHATFTNNQPGVIGAGAGFVYFFNSSNAGSATFVNNASYLDRTDGGGTNFFGNSSAGSATFINNEAAQAGQVGGMTRFFDNSTADQGTFHTIGSAVVNSGDALRSMTVFYNDSTAANGVFINHAAPVTQTAGGRTLFNDNAIAASATITNKAGNADDAYFGGSTVFTGTSNAVNANITNEGGNHTGVYGSFTLFQGQSSAGAVTITDFAGQVDGAFGGLLQFQESSTAANANVTCYGSTAPNGYGGEIDLFDSSTAENATLTLYGAAGGGGGSLYFLDDSFGGTSHVKLYGDAYMDLSCHNTPGVTIQSLEGSGDVFLGGNNLTIEVGPDFETYLRFTGSIHDGGECGGTGGSLTLRGRGTIEFTGDSDFTGDMVIDGESEYELSVIGNDTTIVGNVSVLRGKFEWITAHCFHDVEVAPEAVAYGSLGFRGIAPPSPGRNPLVDPALIVDGNYIQQGGGTLQLDVDGTDSASYAHVIVNGVVALAGGSVMELNFVNQFTPHMGDTFNLVNGGTTSGNFDTVHVNGLGPGFKYNVAADDNGHIQLVALNDAQPLVQSAVSQKMHGGTPYDVDLLSPTGIECRSGGATNDYTMIVTFGGPVSVTGDPQAEVTLGTGIVGSGGISNGGYVTVDGNSVTIPLTNIANAQVIRVTLNGVDTGASISNALISMGVLVGDTNGNGTVSASDIGQTKAQSGQAVTAANFRTDVNASGTISAADIGLVKSKSGTALPP